MADSKVHINIALNRYPGTEALLSGAVTSETVQFDIDEIKPIFRAFKPMAKDQAYDASEMAIFTYLQARAYGKPLVLLPVILAARFQHPCLVYNKKNYDEVTPETLPGMKVGVRAYSQTTGAWVRNILAREHNVPLEEVNWITFEDGHLEEYQEPAYVTRGPDGSDLQKMFDNGEVAAAIFGNDLGDDPDIQAVIPDAKNAGRRAYEKTGLIPINHMLCVTKAFLDAEPEAVRELYRMCRDSKAAATVDPDQPDLRPIGFDAIQESLEEVIHLAHHQEFIPEKYSVDDLFAGARQVLGDG